MLARHASFQFSGLALVSLAFAAPAAAQSRTSPLDGQPTVRHKEELRDGRFEITPTFEASISAPFKNTLAGGLKIEYHITDVFSVDALFFFGSSLNTGLLDQVADSLPTTDAPASMDLTPSRTTALSHANSIPIHGGVGLTFTPFFGKLALFQKAFLAYDIYLSGGFGFAKTENDFQGDDKATTCEQFCDDATKDPRDKFTDPRNDGPHNAAFNPGVQFGGGLHLFFNNWAALDIYVRDYMFGDNPSGLDFNNDNRVDDSDRRFLSHLFVGVGIAFYLPTTAKISR
jgi:outer membrane beta-barrel protein